MSSRINLVRATALVCVAAVPVTASAAQSDTVFAFHTVGGTIRFVADKLGPATHFFLTIVEGDIKATRK